MNRRSFIQTTAMTALAAGTARTLWSSPAKTLYEPTWGSLDSHQCPQWYKDAKLGMYIHWGICSVPAWAPRKGGTPYAEWYGYCMNDPKNPTYQYHRKTYGENFTYDDFFPMFKAEHYNPEEWVALAKMSGMKYLFINAKHHDGHCLWPTRYTHRNAYETGPKRDLIQPLAEAAHSAGLKFGFYYSFYEWYNPLYTGKPYNFTGLIPYSDFVKDFMVKQVQELIDLYHPDMLYFDGEWDKPPEFWQSREFVAYYYNQALERGQEVLINDRYGKGSRGKHGDVFNVEYDYGKEIEGLLTHPWSYWRGLDKTYGYNKDSGPEDFLTMKETIHMLVEGTSRNGNFDINIGPTADGVIPEIQKEKLIALGKWLEINGEAIYGTNVCTVTSEGDVRFTGKGDYVYALCLKWPEEKLVIKSVRAVEGSTITMLGVPGNLEWRQDNEGLTIEYPLYKSRPASSAYAWAFKIKIK